jgi:5-methyltetrahydrofolate--homocysteine methyltransferase
LISLTFERKKRGFFTVMGDPLVASLVELAAAGATAVGANCSVTSAEMRDLVDEAIAGVGAPLVIQPNAGAPRTTTDGVVWYDQSPEEFADDMAAIAARGVAVVGGCCGTDDRFIASLSRRLQRAVGSSS